MKFTWEKGDVIVKAPIKVGAYVENFGNLCYVREVRKEGLVVENPRIGRWIADPDKCTVVKNPIEEI